MNVLGVLIICSISLLTVKARIEGCASNNNTICQKHGTCVEAGSWWTCLQCDCKHGYGGDCCLTDINECSSNPCQHGICYDNVNSYTCSCLVGFTGTNCETDINECSSNPCQHGICYDNVNSYTCSCLVGFTGTHCETDINECSSSPCLYGTCTDKINGYTCSCHDGFTGTHCEIGIDECMSQPCQNNGTCVDQHNGYKCFCLSGDSGQNCIIHSHSSFRPAVILSEVNPIDEGRRDVTIPCFAEGIPTPSVKWTAVYGNLQANVKQIGHYLVFENITMANAGYYMCAATNRAGTDIKAIQIKVIPKPLRQHTVPLIVAPATIQVYYYADAKLVCNATGFPTPVIQWKFMKVIQNTTGATLTVSRVTNATAGLYSCIATNDVGRSQANIMLAVSYDPPKIVNPPLPIISTSGESHNFTCTATGHPVPVVSWTFNSFSRLPVGLPRHVTFDNGFIISLVNMQESGVLTCTAENEFGSDTKSTHVIVKQSTAVFG